MKEVKIRKCEKFTSYIASQAASLDPEKFRKLSIPFHGNTEDEFLTYIAQNREELEGISNEIDNSTLIELDKIWNPNYTEYDNTAWSYEDSWHELANES